MKGAALLLILALIAASVENMEAAGAAAEVSQSSPAADYQTYKELNAEGTKYRKYSL